MVEAGWTEGDYWLGKPLIGSKAAPKNEVLAKLLEGGVHLTDKAYNLMFDALMEVIQEKLPDRVPERLPVIFPDWKEKLGVQQ